MIAPGRKAIAAWSLQLLASGILAQTLIFKFAGAPESVYIFTALGVEPWGRIGSGIVELVLCVMLLVPRTAALGAVGSLGVITVALVGHLTRLGIVVMDDGGLLFALACLVFACAATISWIRRAELPAIGRWFRISAPKGT